MKNYLKVFLASCKEQTTGIAICIIRAQVGGNEMLYMAEIRTDLPLAPPPDNEHGLRLAFRMIFQ